MLLQSELERLGIASKNSRPYHPQTCGKIERLHQTLKRYLTKQPPANTLPELQAQLDTFVHYYNDIRPHRALDGRTPLQAYSTRIKAKPTNDTSPAPTHFRVRQDKVDETGKVSLRYHSRLYKIGLGRAHKGRTIKLLVADQQHPRHRPPRTTHPRAHARPNPQLPTPHTTLNCPQSPDTCVQHVPRHNIKRMKGFEPSTFAMARRRSSQLSYIRKVRPFYSGRRARTW